jgi:hypothetical protein
MTAAARTGRGGRLTGGGPRTTSRDDGVRRATRDDGDGDQGRRRRRAERARRPQTGREVVRALRDDDGGDDRGRRVSCRRAEGGGTAAREEGG